MKANRILVALAVLFVLCGYVSSSHAGLLFSDNFESGLSQWTSTNGKIVPDPLNSSNHVLNFNQLKSGGDAFTASSFTLTSGVTYTFSFDYLGKDSSTGGFAGISPVNTTVPVAGWVFAGFSYGNAQLLTNDNTWHSYKFSFSDTFIGSIGGQPVYLTFQQATGNTPGTAYFDNVSLSSPTSPVPIPPTMLLLGSGFVGLIGFRRKFRK